MTDAYYTVSHLPLDDSSMVEHHFFSDPFEAERYLRLFDSSDSDMYSEILLCSHDVKADKARVLLKYIPSQDTYLDLRTVNATVSMTF